MQFTAPLFSVHWQARYDSNSRELGRSHIFIIYVDELEYGKQSVLDRAHTAS